MSSVIFTWSSRITLGLLASWLCAATASAAVITVTTDLDAPLANDGECTLREAITNAQVNSTAGSTDCVAGGAIDEIVFSTYFDTPRTINLVSNLPFLSGHMTVSGPGLANLTISGGGTHRIFIVSDADGTPNSSVTIRDLTLRDGLADGNGGGAIVSLELLTLTRLRLENNNAGVGSGGAVRLQAGTLLVQNSLFKGNSAPDASFGLGGAISASNLTTSLQIVSSVFDGNSAQLGGGAVYSLATNTTAFNSTFARNTASANLGGGALNVPGASLSIDRSWITENSVGAPGGGIQFTGNTLTLTRTTLDNNIATRGSGVSHAGNGTSSLRNNTFSGNQSTFGSGALSVADTAQAVVQFNTFYGNSASGGGRAVQNIGFGTVSIEASLLVTGNTSTNLCGGTMTVSADTLVENGTCSGGTNRGIALFNSLTALQNNGAVIPTHAPMRGSSAIDAASDCRGLTSDERGNARPADGDRNGSALCDPGAVEYRSITVDTTIDGGGTDGQCSLREAILNANANLVIAPDCAVGSGADTIEFSITTPATITLGSALPQISESLGIYGPGEAALTINAVGGSPHFVFDDGDNNVDQPMQLQGMTLINGTGPGTGSVYSSEALAVDRMTFSGNVGTGANAGGAITQSQGLLSINRSTFSGNQSTSGAGGAVVARNTDSVEVNESSFQQNSAAGSGGGLALIVAGAVQLQRSTFSGNTSGSPGGAVMVQAGTQLEATNSTFSGNQGPGQGGTVFVTGSLAVLDAHHLTFRGNSAGAGLALRIVNSATVNLSDSILSAGGVAGNQCSISGGTLNAQGTNLVTDSSCAGITSTGAGAIGLAAELADNGGSTRTHALLPGSAAIDAATDCAGITIDQRGIGRGGDGDLDGVGACDIGAYELVPLVVNTVADTVDSADSLCSLREAMANANADNRGNPDCARGLGADLIYFNLPIPSTITLGSSLPQISDALAIVGPGTADLTLDANQTGRHFRAGDGNAAVDIPVAISAMTLINGRAGSGGAFLSAEALTVDQVEFRNNTANGTNGGGAIALDAGSLVLTRSSFSGNVADNGAGAGNGGALFVQLGADASVQTSAFVDNRSADYGGAVHFTSAGATEVSRSEFTGNHSGLPGGAVSSLGTSNVLVDNSTFSGNLSDAAGGAIGAIGGTVALRHATFWGNQAVSLGHALRANGSGSITVSDSVLVRGAASAGLCSVGSGSIGFSGANLIEDGSCAGQTASSLDTIRLDPVLANNGGATRTHALLLGSAAIDAGADCVGLPADQRLFSRVVDGNLDSVAVCDIGAFELRPIIVDTTADVTDNADGLCSLREAIANANQDRRQYASCLAGGGPDVIGFNLPGGSTITLTGALPDLTTPISIVGPGRDLLGIDANAAGRHVTVSNGDPSVIEVNMSGLSLRNASANGTGGSIASSEQLTLRGMRFVNNTSLQNPGGAISANAGSLRVEQTDFTGNTASHATSGRGGALRVAGGATATIIASNFDNNTAVTYGGAMAVDNLSSASISTSRFQGNHANADGGAVDANGGAQATILQSLISGNSATQGGGLSVRDGSSSMDVQQSTLVANQASSNGGGWVAGNGATATGVNLTFSSNVASGEGGAMYLSGAATLGSLTGSTLFGNQATGTGKAVRALNATLLLDNALLEDNGVAGNLCVGASISASAGTVADDASCNGGVVSEALMLDPVLANNGGATPTHLPLRGTAATDVAATCASLIVDQRGLPRPSGAGRCDAGAVEIQNGAPVAINDATAVNEATLISNLHVLTGAGFASAPDTDPDNDALQVVAITYLDAGNTPVTVPVPGGGQAIVVLPSGVSVTQGSNGGLTVNPGTSLLYLTPGQSLLQQFDYVVSDGYSRDVGTVSVTFNGVDTPPSVTNDSLTVAIDAAATVVNVLANDTDPDGGPKSITSVTHPAHGTVVLAGDGLSLTYQPAPAYCNGGMPTDDFTYTVNGSVVGTVSVRVNCGPAGIDLAISIDGVSDVAPGGNLAYTVTIRNLGDVDAQASIGVLFDARLSNVAFTCTLSNGTCPGGSGDISQGLAIGAGQQAVYSVTARAPAVASNTPLAVVGSVGAASGGVDVNPANNDASFFTRTTLFVDGFETPVAP